MAKNIQNPTPAAAPEPAALPEAIIEPVTAGGAIKALISALGHEPADVASIEIMPRVIRVLGKDRSLRGHKIEEWNAKEDASE